MCQCQRPLMPPTVLSPDAIHVSLSQIYIFYDLHMDNRHCGQDIKKLANLPLPDQWKVELSSHQIELLRLAHPTEMTSMKPAQSSWSSALNSSPTILIFKVRCFEFKKLALLVPLPLHTNGDSIKIVLTLWIYYTV